MENISPFEANQTQNNKTMKPILLLLLLICLAKFAGC
jgi:hypothetical protein